MSLLGKILAIFNVLAALAFLYLAIQDLNARRAWSQAVLRHDTVIQGLPLNEDERDQQGFRRVDNLRGTVEEMFKGEPAAATQEKEVERVRSALQAKMGEGAGKGKMLAQILLAQARSGEERERLAARIEAPEPVTEDLEKQFNNLFTTINQLKDPGAKRLAIAHFLLSAAPFMQPEGAPADAARRPLDNTAYKRVLKVVGLENALRVLDAQTEDLQRMTEEAEDAIDRDRLSFVQARRLWLELLTAFADEIDRERSYLSFQDAQVSKQQVEVNARKSRVKDEEEQLAQTQDAVKQKLKEQSDKEALLFKRQSAIRQALKENAELERQIQELEGTRVTPR